MACWGKITSKGDPSLKILFRVRAKRQQFVIGRRADCALKLDDRHISTLHLHVTAFVDDSGSLVTTCRDTSTNGTFLDGVKIPKDVEMPMYDGTVITLPCDESQEDKHTFYVSIGGPPGGQPGPTSPSSASTDPTLGSSQRFGGIPYYEGGAGSSRFAGLGITGGTSASLPATQSEMDRERQRAGTITSTVGQVLDLQDRVTRETARLAASVYNNGEILEKLIGAAEDQQNVERDNAVEETSATLWRASYHMRRLVFDMMKTLENVNEIVCSAEADADATNSSDVLSLSRRVQSELSIEAWRHAVEIMKEPLKVEYVEEQDAQQQQQHEVLEEGEQQPQDDVTSTYGVDQQSQNEVLADVEEGEEEEEEEEEEDEQTLRVDGSGVGSGQAAAESDTSSSDEEGQEEAGSTGSSSTGLETRASMSSMM